jgi:hypothetical protein
MKASVQLVHDLCCRVCEPRFSYMDTYAAVLLDFMTYCRYAHCCTSWVTVFLGDVSILASLSYKFSSFSVCLLYVLVLYRMEISAQTFSHIWICV